MIPGNTIPEQAAATVNGVPIDLGDSKEYSISVNISGADVAGTLKLQARNITTENWIDVADSSQAVASSEDHIWSVVNASYRYVRPVFTYTSGTGNITANYVIKLNRVVGA